MSLFNGFITTENVKLQNSRQNFIEITAFFGFVGLDLILVIVSFIIWRYLWVNPRCLSIRDIETDDFIKIQPNQSYLYMAYCLRKILKNITDLNCYVIRECGFQAYTYLFFLQRLSHLMTILLITDITIWLPYQLFFSQIWSFSLITMHGKDNEVFRTFYTLWVALVFLYGMHNMKKYLSAQLNFILFTVNSKQQCMLNNLKSKTIHIHFLGQQNDELQIKAKLIEDFKIQDRILAIKYIPNSSKLLQLEYRQMIRSIVQEIGIENMSCLWKMLKKKDYHRLLNQLQEDRRNIMNEHRKAYNQKNHEQIINSFFICIDNIETATNLCNQFQTTQALYNICPQFGYGDDLQYQGSHNIIVKWAQQAEDIMWINMTTHTTKMCKFITFNGICILLLVASFFFIALTTNQKVIIGQLPRVLGPIFIIIINSTMRFLISKATQWENKIMQSELQIKQFKMTSIYFVINVMVGSIVRDTLNLLDILQTGWGWIELFSLIYSQVDGLFYYLFIINQTAISFFSTFIKPGQLFPDYYQSKLYYEKVTRVKHLSRFGTNDTFRYGYCYALDFIVLSIVVLYSCSCPLIHSFGLLYFLCRFYCDGYTLVVYHRQEQTCSNMRLIAKVIQLIQILIVAWIFLTATTMMFEQAYSNIIILYLAMGLIIYYTINFDNFTPLKDLTTDHLIKTENLSNVINKWKYHYQHPFNAQNIY